MISQIERKIAFRFLKPKKKEGFLKLISIFSFTGIALGVAILIIVMSVMNGFRAELINKILGFNPHIVVKPYNKQIDQKKLNALDSKQDMISRTTFTFNGQAVLINKKSTTGVFVRSYLDNDIEKIELVKNGIIDGSLESFNKNMISIGKELAISLNLVVGDEIALISTSSHQTPFGNLPFQEKFEISSVFSTGFAEFDQNVIFMPFKSAESLFELTDQDIDLEIYLKNPEHIHQIKKDIQKIFSDH